MSTKSGQPLFARPFSSKVTLIPSLVNGVFTGRPYKAELVLARSLMGGARQHVWFEPDPRPHNHPWQYIDCKVIHGRYTAIEYTPVMKDEGGLDFEYSPQTSLYEERIVVLCAGDAEHRLVHECYHQVVKVLPGTITVMSFGPVVGDGKRWGNLVRVSGNRYRHEPNSTSSDFLNALRHLNPHMRPDGWVDPYEHIPVPDVQELMAAVGLYPLAADH